MVDYHAYNASGTRTAGRRRAFGCRGEPPSKHKTSIAAQTRRARTGSFRGYVFAAAAAQRFQATAIAP